MTRRWKLLLGLAIALLAVRIALPPLLVRIIEGRAREALGRAVELKDVDLFLLAGRITLEDLLVGGPIEPGAATAAIDPDTALLRCPSLVIDVGWLGLLTGELRVDRVEVKGARELLRLQSDHRLEPLVVKRPQAPEPPAETALPSPPVEAVESADTGDATPESAEKVGGSWPLRVERLVLTDQSFVLLDAARPSQPPVELSLAELSVGDLVVSGERVSIGTVGLRRPRLLVLRDLEIVTAPPPGAGEAGAHPTPAPAPGGAASREGALPDIRLASLAIQGAQLGLLHGDDEIEVSLDLSVQNASLEPDARFPVQLRLTREDGWLEVNGDVGLAPVAFTGTVRWKNLPVVGLLEAANPEVPLHLRAGGVDGDLKVDLKLADSKRPGRASVRGRVAAKRIELRHEEGLLEFDCQGIELVADEIGIPLQSDQPVKLSLASLHIEKPALKLVRRSAGESSSEEAAPPEGESGSSAAAPQIALRMLEVNGGSLQLVDETVEPTTTTTLSDIQLEGSELRFPQRDGHLEADLRGTNRLSLEIAGSWQKGVGKTQVALRGLQLPTYSPYLTKAAGFRFERGSARLDASIESGGPTHEVDATLTLEKIALADVKKGVFESLFGMPAPLAVSLLTDARGNIRLPLQLTVDESGADIDLPALMIGALRQSLSAVLAAPLKGLGLAARAAAGVVHGGRLNFDPVRLEPGSAELAPEQLDRAGAIAKGLLAHPEIGLLLSAQVGKEDEPILRAQALLERIDASSFAPYQEMGVLQRRRLRRALERRARLEPDGLDREEAAVLDGWLAEVEVSGDARERLARQRVEAVRSVLVDTNHLDAAQVRIGAPREGPPGVAIDLFAAGQ